MKQKLRPEWVWLGLLAAVLLAAVLAFASVLIQKYVWAQNTLKDVAPRHAMLSGLQAQDTQLKALQIELKKNHASFVVSSDSDESRVGTDALQRVRDLAIKNGLQVVSSQVMPSRDESGLQRIGLSFRIEGDYDDLTLFLDGLSDLKPRIYSDNLQLNGMNAPVLRRGRGPRGAEPVEEPETWRVNAQLGLFVLRVKP